jgi:aspartyl/glutamyl-tRNA(Asn/Gln) amidotransferase C subunit
MNIDEVRTLAALARIHLTDEEATTFAAEADAILGYVDHVKSLSLGEREAVVSRHVNPLRADISTHEAGIFSDDIIAAFPKKAGRHALVKRILGGSDVS